VAQQEDGPSQSLFEISTKRKLEVNELTVIRDLVDGVKNLISAEEILAGQSMKRFDLGLNQRNVVLTPTFDKVDHQMTFREIT